MDKNDVSLLSLTPSMNAPSLPRAINAVLKAPTAHGVKRDQEELTYLQKGVINTHLATSTAMVHI